MGTFSVEFTRKYSSGTYTPTIKVKVTVNETYDEATNTSLVKLTAVNLYSSVFFGQVPVHGKITLNGTVVANFSGGYAHTVNASTAYNSVSYSGSYGSVTVQHNSDGTASVAVGVAISDTLPAQKIFGFRYNPSSGANYYFGVTAPDSKTVAITTQTKTLTVDPNGGSWSGSSAQRTISQAPTSTREISNPSRTGYTFLGWKLTGGGSISGSTYTFGSEDGVLTAQWGLKTYALSISEGTGSNIVVKRGSTTLSDGALITYGDELTITFTATSGYNLETQTVNGVSFTSGGTLTVTSDTSVVSTARLKTFTLTILQGANSSIAVMRENEVLSNGATITYGDELTISFSSPPGYDLNAHTVNGSSFESGGKHTVTGAVSVASTAALKTFALSISEGTGSNIVVKRGSTTLSNGATITYGDELTIIFSASNGYDLGTHTVNGETFASGGTLSVTTAVSVVGTATLKTFLLSISAERGANVLVKRGSSTLSDGATITYGDVIEITVTAAVGYLVREVTLNDGELVSPSVVRADIRIEATAIPAGANIAAGKENIPYQFAIDTGSAYEIFIPVLDNGQSWELY